MARKSTKIKNMTNQAGHELAKEELLSKLMKYCAYRDRCKSEVRTKLDSFHVTEEVKEAVFATLIEEGFVDEERFARMFTRSKFNQNSWGRIKIKQALREKQVDEQLINTAMKEIDTDDYLAVLHRLLQQKIATFQDQPTLEQKHKLAQFAIRKGYEPQFVYEELERVEKNDDDAAK